jgi:hypothetical protein
MKSMLRAIGSILLLILLGAFSGPLLASTGQIEWSLELGECVVVHVDPVTTVLVRRDPKSWTKAKEQIVVSVIQPSWNYHFFGVGEGDEFVVQGSVYRLSSIHDDAFHQVIVRQHGCTPPGYVTVTKVGNSVSDKGEGSVILSGASMGTVSAGIGSCSAKIKLNTLSQAKDGSYVADIEWSELSPTLKDPSCNRSSPVPEHQVIKVGSIIQTKGYGSLQVESIWPKNGAHSDWVVLTSGR